LRKEIHPEYYDTKIVCACGNVIETRSTKKEIRIEICSSCHPFFTGKQKLVRQFSVDRTSHTGETHRGCKTGA